MTYARRFRPFTGAELRDISTTIKTLAADYRRGIITQPRPSKPCAPLVRMRLRSPQYWRLKAMTLQQENEELRTALRALLQVASYDEDFDAEDRKEFDAAVAGAQAVLGD